MELLAGISLRPCKYLTVVVLIVGICKKQQVTTALSVKLHCLPGTSSVPFVSTRGTTTNHSPFQRPSRLRARRGTSKHDEHADPDSSRRDNLVMSARFPLGGAGEEDWLAVAEEAFRLPSPPPPPSPHGPPFLSVKPGSRPSDTGGGSEGHSTFTVSTAGVDTSCERTAHEMRLPLPRKLGAVIGAVVTNDAREGVGFQRGVVSRSPPENVDDADTDRWLWRMTDGGAGGGMVGPLVMLATVAALTGLFIWCEHDGTIVGLDWLGSWLWGTSSTSPATATSGAQESILHDVHLTPLRSVVTGAGAGLTRAVSRTFTFPMDTIKTRRQVSGLRQSDREAMPQEMCRVIDQPASFKGVFRGFSAFLVQAAPSNAMFFLFYDALNALGGAVLLALASGGEGSAAAFVGSTGWLSTALHLVASSLATVPCNLVRTPAEVVKQRLQVGQEQGSSLSAVKSIVRDEGLGGLFVGGKEQLMREIPFNALQFTMYECLKSYAMLPEIWTDAALGAASSSAAALATQPIDTVKTRVMTKSVPGTTGRASPGFLKSAASIAEAEGLRALYLGTVPRIVIVSTGGAFYFWGQEVASQLLSRAGI